jgi:hypothetical protein
MKKWRYRIGTIQGVRGHDRTWSVLFEQQEGFARKRKFMVFRRHELLFIRRP